MVVLIITTELYKVKGFKLREHGGSVVFAAVSRLLFTVVRTRSYTKFNKVRSNGVVFLIAYAYS